MNKRIDSRTCPACGAGLKEEWAPCPACGLTRLAAPPGTPVERMNLPDLPLIPEGARVLIAGPSLPPLPPGYDWTVEEAGAELNDPDGHRPFDVILLFGHLEGSADPLRDLMAARAHLSPRGLLYLEVTDGGRWHIPLNALRRLIEHAGFRVVKRPGRFNIGRFSLDRFIPGRRHSLRLWCRRY